MNEYHSAVVDKRAFTGVVGPNAFGINILVADILAASRWGTIPAIVDDVGDIP